MKNEIKQRFIRLALDYSEQQKWTQYVDAKIGFPTIFRKCCGMRMRKVTLMAEREVDTTCSCHKRTELVRGPDIFICQCPVCENVKQEERCYY